MASEEKSALKPQVYVDPRPPEHFTRFHERVRRGRPDWMYELVRMVLTPFLIVVWRARCIDSPKVPLHGPAIIAPNHFSFLDHFFVAVYLRRKVNFMAKSQLFSQPIQFVFTHGGVFPVMRGRRDEEAFETAHAVLARGGIVVMYCEGGRSRSGELGDPKPGVGRLALESGVPVVPTAIVGTQKARNWKRLQFPKVTTQFGDPISFEKLDDPSRDQAQATSEIVFARIKTMYSALSQPRGRQAAIKAAREAARAGQVTPQTPVLP
ncbi:MAG: 1-acyl-sn-glycerol-3-phosphate acyltransferase [Thermoleophilaceae bacterium]|jgi:1-acyl-sn-glycerol-3-phosphate acyltransferase|nr:1-acyl-sn-glycerol-3-phosphate acyltransferase [Thermoleophilaceae bacterium]